MSKITRWNASNNTLYVSTEAIMPDTSGMTFRKRCEVRNRAFELPVLERAKRYAKDSDMREIMDQLNKHKGCKVSEYMSL